MGTTERLPSRLTLIVLLSLSNILIARAFLAPSGWLRLPPDAAPPRKQEDRTTSVTSSSSVLSRKNIVLAASLWDRLEIEEDTEPMWYLLNCVAGLEMDLLKQCREVCKDMPDAVKFVVPTERKTRSHGANRMVTETKVKYQGYVFGKLRLCKEVYDAIQGLDLCRSWMGTVNWKGYKKLPPAPVALNELEVENFGLEDEDSDDEDNGDEMDLEMDQDVIVDDGEEAKDQVDQDAIKAYLGLKVEDMVKVTKPGKFNNEDGIVRRLKEGKIFVRFYTYGTMFEEWLEPGDVRKLSEMEVLKGLSGPTKPITQRDFDGPGEGYNNRRGRGDGPDLRRSLVSNMKGGGPRNRRQDRAAGQYKERDFFGRTEEERLREERNWRWYQDQQRDKDTSRVRDGAYSMRSGSKEPKDDDWAMGDVDSQWGRQSQRQERRQRNKNENLRAEAAIQGEGDWSAFVSSPSQADGGQDDFFDSLIQDLSEDLGTKSKGTKKTPASSASDDDDFFASLMSDLKEATKDEPNQSRRKTTQPVLESPSQEDDFFASLEAELGDTLSEGTASKSDDAFDFLSTDSKSGQSSNDEQDDFFSQLESDLSSALDDTAVPSSSSLSEEESKPKPPSKAPSHNSDLGSLTVPELKDMLREKGLKVTGKKAELIERLKTGVN